MHVIYRHDGTGRRVWMLPLRTGAELRTASHLALRDLTVTADPGSRHVARWETQELAQAACWNTQQQHGDRRSNTACKRRLRRWRTQMNGGVTITASDHMRLRALTRAAAELQ